MANKYQKYIKQNPEKMTAESNRIKSYLNEKYKNNEEYREKRIQYQRDYRARKKIANTAELPQPES
jgi:hypothetical protein